MAWLGPGPLNYVREALMIDPVIFKSEELGLGDFGLNGYNTRDVIRYWLAKR